MGRFTQLSQRIAASGRPAASQGDPNQLYDQANQDLTQGRYALALQGFRDFVRRYPTGELSDNAQYGVGECFFAQSRLRQRRRSSTRGSRAAGRRATGCRRRSTSWGSRRERLGQTDAAKKTFEDLVKRFPNSGEAQLARERLGSSRGR